MAESRPSASVSSHRKPRGPLDAVEAEDAEPGLVGSPTRSCPPATSAGTRSPVRRRRRRRPPPPRAPPGTGAGPTRPSGGSSARCGPGCTCRSPPPRAAGRGGGRAGRGTTGSSPPDRRRTSQMARDGSHHGPPAVRWPGSRSACDATGSYQSNPEASRGRHRIPVVEGVEHPARRDDRRSLDRTGPTSAVAVGRHGRRRAAGAAVSTRLPGGHPFRVQDASLVDPVVDVVPGHPGRRGRRAGRSASGRVRRSTTSWC